VKQNLDDYIRLHITKLLYLQVRTDRYIKHINATKTMTMAMAMAMTMTMTMTMTTDKQNNNNNK
jgi:hypothetical protein